jgi:hypothetical protein
VQEKDQVAAGCQVQVESRTLLQLAAFHGALRCASLLLSRGANPGRQSADGLTAYDVRGGEPGAAGAAASAALAPHWAPWLTAVGHPQPAASPIGKVASSRIDAVMSQHRCTGVARAALHNHPQPTRSDATPAASQPGRSKPAPSNPEPQFADASASPNAATLRAILSDAAGNFCADGRSRSPAVVGGQPQMGAGAVRARSCLLSEGRSEARAGGAIMRERLLGREPAWDPGAITLSRPRTPAPQPSCQQTRPSPSPARAGRAPNPPSLPGPTRCHRRPLLPQDTSADESYPPGEAPTYSTAELTRPEYATDAFRMYCECAA